MKKEIQGWQGLLCFGAVLLTTKGEREGETIKQEEAEMVL